MSSNHNLFQVKFDKHILEEEGTAGEALSEKLVPSVIREENVRTENI